MCWGHLEEGWGSCPRRALNVHMHSSPHCWFPPNMLCFKDGCLNWPKPRERVREGTASWEGALCKVSLSTKAHRKGGREGGNAQRLASCQLPGVSTLSLSRRKCFCKALGLLTILNVDNKIIWKEFPLYPIKNFMGLQLPRNVDHSPKAHWIILTLKTKLLLHFLLTKIWKIGGSWYYELFFIHRDLKYNNNRGLTLDPHY